MARLLKTYPSLTREEILWDLPCTQGWALFNWSLEHDGWLQFAGLKRASKGYVGQQIEQMVKQAITVYSNGKING